MKRNNLKKNLSLALKLLFLFTLNSCGSIQSLDRAFCVEINISKGFCTTPISGKDQFVDDTNLLEGLSWFDMRPTMIMIPPSTYAALKKFIILQCKRHPDTCDSEIPSWDRATATIDAQINSKQP